MPMYTTAALLDIHARTHRSLTGTLDHLATLPAENLQRTVEGFSYPTLCSQLHHVFGAERYWFEVLQGSIRLDDDEAEHRDLASLRALRASVEATTAQYLGRLSDDDVSAARTVKNWKGDEVSLLPAHVLLRTQTHAYQHQGEIASMLRQLGHGFPPGLDFPLA
ncbi:MAG: DinB family protein [Planctomycetota bacterium]|nr:DinB family protein [Planctomycetota bacterium]